MDDSVAGGNSQDGGPSGKHSTAMKTTPAFRTAKHCMLLVLLISIGASLLAQPTLAHEIVLTENSSTSLTVTYDGSPTGFSVTNTGSDRWTVICPVYMSIGDFGGGGVRWLEPGSSGDVAPLNFFTSSPPPTAAVLSVYSDVDLPTAGAFANGALSPAVGGDFRDNMPIFARFIDNQDAAKTPDVGATLGLLAFSLLALFGVSRRWSVRVLA